MSTSQKTIIMLMSVGDGPTWHRLHVLSDRAEQAGYRLLTVFALDSASRRLRPKDLAKRLITTCAQAGYPVAGLVVHHGMAFSSHPSEYRRALMTFRERYPEIPIATEALRGKPDGALLGIRFDQPPELDFILTGWGAGRK